MGIDKSYHIKIHILILYEQFKIQENIIIALWYFIKKKCLIPTLSIMC